MTARVASGDHSTSPRYSAGIVVRQRAPVPSGCTPRSRSPTTNVISPPPGGSAQAHSSGGTARSNGDAGSLTNTVVGAAVVAASPPSVPGAPVGAAVTSGASVV